MPTAKFTVSDTDKYIDYDTFLSKDFDANTYATSIVKKSELSSDAIDVGTELSKIAFSIDIVNKQIQEQVVSNYEKLLSQVVGIKDLETILNTIELNINGLNTSLQSLSHKIRDPYKQLSAYATQLENMQITCELLRKIHRFTLLKRRLELQLSTNEQDISTAALTVYELETIMATHELDGIDIVSCELSFVKVSHQHIEQEANTLLKEGIETQNQTKMATGLQVFYNMKKMCERVQDMTEAMLNDLTKEMKQVVDIQSLQKETGATRPSMNPKQLATSLWQRMESLMKSMSDQCIKVYRLEKVLEIKKDTLTHMSFLEEVSKASFDLVSYFWRALSANFEKELKEASKASTFLQNTFVSDYPKLLKLLNDFFARVAMHNGTGLTDYSQTPEYVIMLRSFGTFQSSFLAKSLQRMNDAVNSTFPTYGGLARTPPGRNNVINITRIMGHELETVAFEPQLAQLLAKNA
ncbi:hypothetical protein CU098_001481, partial [Rhizopus stolonifer]